MSSDAEALRAIRKVQQAVTEADVTAGAVMRAVAEQACRATCATGAVVELAEGDELVRTVTAGSLTGTEGARLVMVGTLSGESARTGTILVCDDSESDERVDREACRRAGARSIAVVPLMSGGIGHGVLKVIADRPNSFGAREVDLLENLAQFIVRALDGSAAADTHSQAGMLDPLTGLANRASFLARLERAIAMVAAFGNQALVLHVDLEGFEPIIDTYGQAVGDELLRVVAGRINSNCRADDLAARLGRDEFAVLLAPSANPNAVALRDRLTKELHKPIPTSAGSITVHASCGTTPVGSADLAAAVLERAVAATNAERRANPPTHGHRLPDTGVGERAEGRDQQHLADALYRRSVGNAAIGMCLMDSDGRFIEVNDAICKFFGYDAETLMHKPWQQLTTPEFLEADLSRVADVMEGRLDSYRMLKKYIHANGHVIWGDLSVSCTRDQAGRVERFISQINDVTATVEAGERDAALVQQVNGELRSAARYVASIMPTDLSGAVNVSSRFLPSGELGGDCFYYTWIDDHLVVYLIDVSGHGIEPAMLAASLQNILRSGTFATDTLLDPAAVLTELNRRFQTEQQNELFFTMWYGVYQLSTRTLRYSTAGHPPALLFNRDWPAVTVTPLSTAGLPIGMFEDSSYTCDELTMPPAGELLIYSDGAFEVRVGPADSGNTLSHKEFVKHCGQLSARTDWSLDLLVDELKAVSSDGNFGDDCSLILLSIP